MSIFDVGGMKREALREGLKVHRQQFIFCESCGGQVRPDSYLLMKPNQGTCLKCGKEWRDDVIPPNVCFKCGYSKDDDLHGCLDHEAE